MASDVEQQRWGDAETPRASPAPSPRAHVVDAAGESGSTYYSSDGESQPQNNKRYINSAICVETLETPYASLGEGSTPHPNTTYRSISTPYLSSGTSGSSVRSRKSCTMDTARRTDSSDDETENNGHTYREDGQDTFRLSVASIETSTTTREERELRELKKKQAFEEWCARKEQEKRERQRLERMKQQHNQQSITPAQREESFRRWVERKQRESLRSKADHVMRRFREEAALDAVRRRKEQEKQEKLLEWMRRKEEREKEIRAQQEALAARAAAEEERRRGQGERAYRQWLAGSKQKPLPVPLNKGELSMRGSVSEMYINPVPWQPLT